jgi:spore coat polysaccharide biosynthesis predicted glycosyltransferase SpsG
MQPITLVADAGPDAGLGHVSRASAVAVALRCRGIETRHLAFGESEPFDCDGVTWAPMGDEAPIAGNGTLVVDSYRLAPDELARAARLRRLVLMHDHGPVPEGASLVISAVGQPSGSAPRISGLEYAALRPSFWGLPRREVRGNLGRVLVTVGGGRLAEVGRQLALAAAKELPQSTVTLVRGPHAFTDVLAGVATLDAPQSLLDPLLSADVVIAAAGQTMLEAVAAGTPCIALPLVENQRKQAHRLAELGAVRLVDDFSLREVAAAVSELASDSSARAALSRRGQHAVDGFGALRVAFHIASLGQGED